MTSTTLTEAQQAERTADFAVFDSVCDLQDNARDAFDAFCRTLTHDNKDELEAQRKQLFATHMSTTDDGRVAKEVFTDKWGHAAFNEICEASNPPVIQTPRKGMGAEEIDARYAKMLATTDDTIAKSKDTWIPAHLAVAVDLRAAIVARDRDAMESIAYRALALDTFWGYQNCGEIVQGLISELFCYDGKDYRYYKVWIEVVYAGHRTMMQAALQAGAPNPRSHFYGAAKKHIEYADFKLDRAIENAKRLAEKEGLTTDFVVPTGHENRTFTDEQTPGRLGRRIDAFSEYV